MGPGSSMGNAAGATRVRDETCSRIGVRARVSGDAPRGCESARHCDTQGTEHARIHPDRGRSALATAILVPVNAVAAMIARERYNEGLLPSREDQELFPSGTVTGLTLPDVDGYLVRPAGSSSVNPTASTG